MVGTSFLVILLLCLLGYLLARRRAGAWARQDATGLHSLPSYHGYLVALWVGIPAFLLVIFWTFFQDSVIEGLLLTSLPERVTDGRSENEIALLVSQIRSIAGGQIFGEPPQELIAAAERLAGAPARRGGSRRHERGPRMRMRRGAREQQREGQQRRHRRTRRDCERDV